MTFKVLACSPDSQFLDEVSSWVSLQSDIEVEFKDDQNGIREKISTGDYSLLLFDNRDWDKPISELIQQVNDFLSSTRVVIFPAWNDLGFPDTAKYPNIQLLTWPVPKEILPSVIQQLFSQLSSQQPESSFPPKLEVTLDGWMTEPTGERDEKGNDSLTARVPFSPEAPSEHPQRSEDVVERAAKPREEKGQPDSLSQEDAALLEPWGVSLSAGTGTETERQGEAAATSQPPESKNPHSLLPYQCVLIPRDRNSFLTTEIARQLSTWLPLLHQDWNCQVTALAIRPLYLSWSLTIPPDTCPRDVIQAIRQSTSERLYEHFPDRFTEGRNDFWADGYLLVSGEHTLPASFLQAFLDRVRSSTAWIDSNLSLRKS